MVQVIVLNGGSSAGKSTLAAAFRDGRAAVGDFWLVVGIDEYLAKLPEDWFAMGENVGAFSHDGMRAEFTHDGVDVSFGPVGRRLLNAYQGAVAAAAHAGLQVIVDELVFDRTQWDDWGVALDGLDVAWVGVRCDADVAEAREAGRGNSARSAGKRSERSGSTEHRTAGKARHSASFAHEHTRYDLSIDTTERTPAEALAELVTGLGIYGAPSEPSG